MVAPTLREAAERARQWQETLDKKNNVGASIFSPIDSGKPHPATLFLAAHATALKDYIDEMKYDGKKDRVSTTRMDAAVALTGLINDLKTDPELFFKEHKATPFKSALEAGYTVGTPAYSEVYGPNLETVAAAFEKMVRDRATEKAAPVIR